jgi:hypothetical protein
MEYFLDVITRFPIINIYQVQTQGQVNLIHADAKELEYYLQARKIIESIFKDTKMRLRFWENYRPLWYDVFGEEKIVNDYEC